MSSSKQNTADRNPGFFRWFKNLFKKNKTKKKTENKSIPPKKKTEKKPSGLFVNIIDLFDEIPSGDIGSDHKDLSNIDSPKDSGNSSEEYSAFDTSNFENLEEREENHKKMQQRNFDNTGQQTPSTDNSQHNDSGNLNVGSPKDSGSSSEKYSAFDVGAFGNPEEREENHKKMQQRNFDNTGQQTSPTDNSQHNDSGNLNVGSPKDSGNSSEEYSAFDTSNFENLEEREEHHKKMQQRNFDNTGQQTPSTDNSQHNDSGNLNVGSPKNSGHDLKIRKIEHKKSPPPNFNSSNNLRRSKSEAYIHIKRGTPNNPNLSQSEANTSKRSIIFSVFNRLPGIMDSKANNAEDLKKKLLHSYYKTLQKKQNNLLHLYNEFGIKNFNSFYNRIQKLDADHQTNQYNSSNNSSTFSLWNSYNDKDAVLSFVRLLQTHGIFSMINGNKYPALSIIESPEALSDFQPGKLIIVSFLKDHMKYHLSFFKMSREAREAIEVRKEGYIKYIDEGITYPNNLTELAQMSYEKHDKLLSSIMERPKREVVLTSDEPTPKEEEGVFSALVNSTSSFNMF